MLFKQDHLLRIKAGEISLAFRKWKKPSVVKGTLLKTAVGQVEILDISPIEQADIDQEQAMLAGYNELSEMQTILNKVKEGTIYKIQLRYHSPDPRIDLRENVDLTDEELELLKKKLDRMDRTGKYGAWTKNVMMTIHSHPHKRAKDLAEILDVPKDWLKINIRKLKNLGLTISHEVGYEISPRGNVVLLRLG